MVVGPPEESDGGSLFKLNSFMFFMGKALS